MEVVIAMKEAITWLFFLMLLGMTYAAKGYFDALVKMGELASESQGSKELGKSPAHGWMESVRGRLKAGDGSSSVLVRRRSWVWG